MYSIIKKIFCKNKDTKSVEEESNVFPNRVPKPEFENIFMSIVEKNKTRLKLDSCILKPNGLTDDEWFIITGREKKETIEEKVIRILKHDFEQNHGISFDEFMVVYKNIIENNPEKLI